MSVYLALILVVAGLALLIFGADMLVRGVSALAAALGVPPLVIGMTVVAFGTSTPEIVVNTMSAWRGETGLAFGNIVGANALNLGFVLALVSIIKPLTVESTVITRELPMMLLAMVSVLILSEDRLLNGEIGVLDRGDGLMLLLLFGVFLYYTIRSVFTAADQDPLVVEMQQETLVKTRARPLWLDGVFILLGLVGVGVGGHITVLGAVELALAMGISEVVIGLTLISFGTTLPELTTSLLAARRGHSDIAIGNLIGSCIFNILCIGGLVATIHPVLIPPGGRGDLLLMLFLGVVLLPMAGLGKRRISRPEGIFLLATYLIYMIYRAGSAATTAGAGA
jgi:cation:H+ antiporter